jgi:predicted dinucleotide-binding enzyme
MTRRFSIGVLGEGPIGVGIGTLLARAGYSVTLGTEDVDATSLHALPSSVQVAGLEIAADCSLAVLAVDHSRAGELVTDLADRLAAKVVIDADNPWLPGAARASQRARSITEGRFMAGLLPHSWIVRAFSHVDWDLLVPSATNEPGRWAVAYSADDEQAASIAAELIFDTGYVPIRIGNLDANELDVGGVLWPGMFTPDQMRAALRSRTDGERPAQHEAGLDA